MTKIKFYHRYKKQNNFLKDLKESFKRSREVYIFTCFFDAFGSNLIRTSITDKKQIKLLVDIRGFEDLDTLRGLVRLSNNKRHKDKIKIRYYKDKNNRLFHSKLYFFISGNKQVAFIGSSNFTGAGLNKSIETNVKLTGKNTELLNEIGGYCKRQWKDASPLNKVSKELKKGINRKKRSSYNENKWLKKIPASEGDYPPWPSVSEIIKASHAKRIRKRQRYKDIKLFMAYFKQKLPHILKNKFKIAVYRGGWSGFVEYGKPTDTLHYEFGFGHSEGVGSHDITSVGVFLRTKDESKRFIKYLNKDETHIKTFSEIRNKLGKYDAYKLRIYRVVQQDMWNYKYNPEGNFYFKKEITQIIKKIEGINKKNYNTAALEIYTETKRPDEKRLKKHMNELKLVYDFIRKGIDG